MSLAEHFRWLRHAGPEVPSQEEMDELYRGAIKAPVLKFRMGFGLSH